MKHLTFPENIPALPSTYPNPFFLKPKGINCQLFEQVRRHSEWYEEALDFFLGSPSIAYSRILLFLVFDRYEIDEFRLLHLRRWARHLLETQKAPQNIEVGLQLLGRIGEDKDEDLIHSFLSHVDYSVFKAASNAIFNINRQLLPQVWLDYISQASNPVKNRFWLNNQVIHLLRLREDSAFDFPPHIQKRLLEKYRPYWIQLLQDTELEMRMQALLTAEALMNDAALPFIIKNLCNNIHITACCDSDDLLDYGLEIDMESGSPFKELAYKALTQGYHSEKTLKVLLKLLKHKGWWKHISPWLKEAYLLEHLSKHYLSLLEVKDFIFLKNHSDPEVRRHVFLLLNHLYMQQKSRERVPFSEWMSLFSSASLQLKPVIIDALAFWHPELTISKCYTWLQAEESLIVATALLTLAKLNQSNAIAYALRLVSDSNDLNRCAAINALGILRDASSAQIIKKYLHGKTLCVAAESLSLLQDDSMTEKLFNRWLMREDAENGFSREAVALSYLLTPEWLVKLVGLLPSFGENKTVDHVEELVSLIIDLIRTSNIEGLLNAIDPERISGLAINQNGYELLLNRLSNASYQLVKRGIISHELALSKVHWIHSDSHRRFLLTLLKQKSIDITYPYIYDAITAGCFAEDIYAVYDMLWHSSAPEHIGGLRQLISKRLLGPKTAWIHKLIQHLENQSFFNAG